MFVQWDSHLTPANIQNKCFSERSHLMFCFMASNARTGFISLCQINSMGNTFDKYLNRFRIFRKLLLFFLSIAEISFRNLQRRTSY